MATKWDKETAKDVCAWIQYALTKHFREVSKIELASINNYVQLGKKVCVTILIDIKWYS